MLKTGPINRVMSGQYFHFMPYENTRKPFETFNFLVFSGGMKWENWLKWVQMLWIYLCLKNIRLEAFPF